MKMHYEYAIDPDAITKSWESFRYIIEKFGFEKGRLISQYPKKWTREVYSKTNSFSVTQRKRAEVALEIAKKQKIIKSRRDYDPQVGQWIDNVAKTHLDNPFHAIISQEDQRYKLPYLDPDDLDQNHPLMVIQRERDVVRQTDEMLLALEAVLLNAKKLIFVDAYFDPYNKDQFNFFSSALTMIAAKNPNSKSEIHYKFRHARANTLDVIESRAYEMLPKNYEITIYCWEEKQGGEDFHARYLLSDLCGVRIDAGFQPTGVHQSTDFSLMAYALAQKRLQYLAPNSSVYNLIGEPLELIGKKN